MKILVTGATGMLGNNLVRMLLQQGHQCAVLLRPPEERRELEHLDVERYCGDLLDSDLVAAAMSGVDVVVHSAAMIHLGWTRLEESRRINVEFSKNIARVAKRNKVRMIHVSSVDALAAGKKDQPATEIDLEPAKIACSYVISKREADEALLSEHSNGLDVVIVHPGLMFGAWDWKPSSGAMITSIAKQFIPFSPRGGISPSDVLDACLGILNAIETGRAGERYVLTGHNMSYHDLWCLIAERLKRRQPISRLGPFNNWCVGVFADVLGKIRGREGQINSASLKLGSLFHYYDASKAISELGYSISPLEPALDRAIEFFVEQEMLDQKFSKSIGEQEQRSH